MFFSDQFCIAPGEPVELGSVLRSVLKKLKNRSGFNSVRPENLLGPRAKTGSDFEIASRDLKLS